MNAKEKPTLEARVDRALKELPALSAPASLLPRVMAALEERAALPWYRQGWLAWPAPARAGSLLVGGLLLAGLVWGTDIGTSGAVSAATKATAEWRTALAWVWSLVETLYETGWLLFRHLNPWIVLGALALVGLANGVCLGLGAVCVRFSFASTRTAGMERTI